MPHGIRYIPDGAMEAPGGKTRGGGRPRVRSVWQLDEGAIAPRLITAHPLEVKS
jgi:hypothetical protein